MIYLSTPFSSKAADQLYKLGVSAFKIGSGECNNIPFLKKILRFKKPIILSTGMNDLDSIKRSVRVIEKAKVINNVKKNIENKKIIKKIYLKNKLINFII